jgi:hypothetical protein
VRRASFRDKDKCRKLDTSFKEVLYATEYKQQDEIETEDYAQTNVDVDKSSESMYSTKNTPNDSLNDEVTLPTPSSSSITTTTPISLKSTSLNTYQKSITSNNMNTSSLKSINDYENQEAQMPLRQIPNGLAHTSNSAIIAKINSNGSSTSTLNKKTNAPQPPHQYQSTVQQTQPQSQPSGQKVSDVHQKVSNFHSASKTFTYTNYEPDGVKYKFVSHEPIGGKSDYSFNSSTNAKFRCSKCSIM